MGNKFTVIVSDLHMGAGLEEGGNMLEDFISDVEFHEFVKDIVAESDASQSPVELIINGDFVEMLQVPATEHFDPLKVYHTEDYEDSTEAGAVNKVRHVMQGHPAVFAALADFIHLGPPRRRVTITRGNHDPEHYWPAWQDQVRQTIGATGALAPLLRFPAVSICEDGLYVEHGNQYLGKLDRFDDFETPLKPKDPTQVVHPIGSRIGVRFVNDIERDRFWVDSIYPATALAWYLLRWDFRFAARLIATFLAAGIEVLGVQLTGGMVDSSAQDLMSELENEARVEELAAQYESDPTFQAQFNQQLMQALEDVELAEAALAEGAGFGPQPSAQEVGDSILDKAVLDLRNAAQAKLAELKDQNVSVVSFGHTHVPERVDLDGGTYINTGTWIWRGDFSGADDDLWFALFHNPTQFSRQRLLSYARIDYDAAGQISQAQLLEFKPAAAADPGNPLGEAPKGCLPAWLARR